MRHKIRDGLNGAVACLALAAPLSALPLNGQASAAGVKPASLYAQWPNGPSQNPKFFPLGVWWQNPPLAGHSGSYHTIASAAVGMHLNVFLGLGPVTGAGTWPETFGHDSGELEAIKASGTYVIAGLETPYNENTSAASVASMLALANSIGATANLIGYTAGDEPQCGGAMENVPTVIQGIGSYDSTRVVSYNFSDWMVNPLWMSPACAAASSLALKAVSYGSLDEYPVTNPWIHYAGSDFLTTPQDSLYMQGLSTAALIHDGRANQPMWVYNESGGDNLGFSSTNNVFSGGVASGSTTLTNASGWSHFTATWIGLTVSGNGLPAKTKITAITDGTHAVLSAAATSTSSGENITVTGGGPANSDCVPGANLCVVNGNEYRATPAQVASEVWMSIINGANGVEYFCHDWTSDSFCMGDVSGGAAAQLTQANLTYLNHAILRFATVLNAPTAGICSMQQFNYTTGAQSTTTSCSNGILTMATSQPTVPGMALVKQMSGATYLFAQSDRRSPSGANFTYNLTGLGGKTATVVYDTDRKYDPVHSADGAALPLSGSGQFTDVLGANHDDYQVKIYRIQ